MIRKKLLIFPSFVSERVIRFFYERHGCAHQILRTTSAKIIILFLWPDLKLDVRLYVACCPVCKMFIRLSRTPRAKLRPMELEGRDDCLAMNIVGTKDLFPFPQQENKYILAMIDFVSRFAIAVPLVH